MSAHTRGLSSRMISFIACIIGMPICAYIFPGVHVQPLYMSIAVGALLGLGFLIVKPVLKVLTVPIGCVTMGVFSIFIDIGLILGLDYLLPGFMLDGWQWGVYCALVITLLRCPALR